MALTAPKPEYGDNDMAEVRRRFSEKLTPAVRSAIRTAGDPVARQYLPDKRELDIRPEERPDPIGDQIHSPVKGIVHRHRDRVLLKAASACAVNCRFCFRKTMLGKPEETLNPRELDQALDYIAGDPEIWEVILTGGDPLILSPRRLSYILDRLEDINHVQIIRFHSRIPVADPQRLNEEYLSLFVRSKPVYMVIHINHSQEITPAAEQLWRSLHEKGVILLSQSVLLKDVNDNVDALERLFRRLAMLKIKPYYLHHPDMVPGTGHFRVDIETGQQLMRSLRRRLSGLCLPSYVLDIPGGYGKISLESACVKREAGGYSITDPQGRIHFYS